MTAAASMESLVQDAVKQVLDISDTPLDANFFALGGDSLAALELMAVLQDALSYELPLDLLFDVDSLGELAARITRSALVEPRQNPPSGTSG